MTFGGGLAHSRDGGVDELLHQQQQLADDYFVRRLHGVYLIHKLRMVKKKVCDFCILAHPANMSHFKSALSSLFTRPNSSYSAGKLADDAGIHRGDFSRLRSGKKSPTRDIIHKLTTCPALEPADSRNLLIAHLRDEVPELLAGMVEIRPSDSARISDGTAEEEKEPLTEALEFIRARAIKNTEFAEFVLGLWRMLAPNASKS